MSPQDIFRILGIEFETDEDLKKIDVTVIKRQYRKLALKLHPDKNKEDVNAEMKFNELKKAYDLMMLEEKRREVVQTLRAGLHRMKEREERDIGKRKFAEELERRESEWSNIQSGKVDSNVLRAHHRFLIEQLQAKREATSKQVRGGPVYGGPDDSNMSLEYWINYGMNEDPETRKNKAEKFSQFILQKLA
jgi:DnaJ-class molecular chaperone